MNNVLVYWPLFIVCVCVCGGGVPWPFWKEGSIGVEGSVKISISTDIATISNHSFQLWRQWRIILSSCSMRIKAWSGCDGICYTDRWDTARWPSLFQWAFISGFVSCHNVQGHIYFTLLGPASHDFIEMLSWRAAESRQTVLAQPNDPILPEEISQKPTSRAMPRCIQTWTIFYMIIWIM